jgi:predicted metal-dependent phosphoesterase TrpH
MSIFQLNQSIYGDIIIFVIDFKTDGGKIMIDMHMHSCFSEDGQYTPPQLVDMCRKNHPILISITDHNCVKANSEARIVSKIAGIHYISGIEIDCTLDNVNFHVLGYGIDENGAEFAEIERNIREQCMRASIERLSKIRSLGFSLTDDELWEKSLKNYWSEMWNGELFAEVLLSKKEYADNPLLAPYRADGSRSDNPFVNFYWDYCSQGKPCFVEMKYPFLKDIIAIIHKNGGKAVLAHPGVNLKGHESLISDIIADGIDGIEAFSSYHTPEIASHYYNLANENDLFVTCGSDFHGRTKPSIQFGAHGCTIDENVLYKHLAEIFNL